MLEQFKAINTTVFGIVCDTPGCGWEDMTVSSRDYKKWIDCPCPDCGASVMTPANYRSFRNLQRVVFVINVVAFPILVVRRLLGYKDKRVHTHVDSKPDGSMEFSTPTMH